jgi:hypothetical protein
MILHQHAQEVRDALQIMMECDAPAVQKRSELLTIQAHIDELLCGALDEVMEQSP